MTTAADRLIALSGLSGVSAGTHLLAIGSGLTAAALLLAGSPLASATAGEHLMAERGGAVTPGGGHVIEFSPFPNSALLKRRPHEDEEALHLCGMI